MNLYGYVKTDDGKEPLGTGGRMIRRDLKTVAGMVRSMRQLNGAKDRGIVVQTFGNFYDPATFTTVYDGF